MENKTLEYLIKREAEKIFDHYNGIFPNAQIKMSDINFKFNLKGRVAGKSFYQMRQLSFNLFYANDNITDFLNRTVPHEIAHLYQTKMYPDSKPHGSEWRMVMQSGGYSAIRCHSYNSNALPKKVNRKSKELFQYGCGCRNKIFELSKNRHGRILNGSKYSCKKCKEFLYFIRKVQ
jgi:SprT protein